MECLASLPSALGPLSRLASAIFTCAFPFEYSAHVARNLGKSAELGRLCREVLFFPLRGGKRHTVFQVFAWALWVLSAAISLHTWHSALTGDGASGSPIGCRRLLLGLHLDAASGAAAVSGLWSQLFLIKALLVFDAGAGRRRRSQGSSHDAATERDSLSAGHVRTVKGQRGQRGTAAPPGAARGGGRRPAGGGRVLLAQQVSDGSHTPFENQQLLAPRAAAHVVCWLGGGAMSVTGCLLLLALEHMPDTQSRVLYCCLALSCVFIGASSTHGLGGYLRHVAAGAARSAGAAIRRSGSGSSSSGGSCRPAAGSEEAEMEAEGGGSSGSSSVEGRGWRFFQPFQGGSVFVATQAIGWTLFSASVVCVLLLAKRLVAGVGYCLRCWALAAGALIMATQLVLGLSILTYQQRGAARRLLLRPALRHPRAELERAAGLVMPVVLMYLPLHISLAAVAATFVLLPPGRAAAAVAGVLLPYFTLTLRGHPAHTGCRRWPWLCAWFSRNVESSLAWWAGRLEVVRDFDGTADQAAEVALLLQAAAAAAAAGGGGVAAEAAASEEEKEEEEEEAAGAGDGGKRRAARRYVLGFHPHGLYPTGAGFVPLMPTIQAAFPGRSILTLTANIVHYAPGLRDIAGWAGFRQVTRATFRRALHDTGAALLCPGGQAELVYADRAFPRPPQPPTQPQQQQKEQQQQRRLMPQPISAAAAGPAAGPLLRLLGSIWGRRAGSAAAAAAAPPPPCTVTCTTPSGSHTTLVSAYTPPPPPAPALAAPAPLAPAPAAPAPTAAAPAGGGAAVQAGPPGSGGGAAAERDGGLGGRAGAEGGGEDGAAGARPGAEGGAGAGGGVTAIVASSASTASLSALPHSGGKGGWQPQQHQLPVYPPAAPLSSSSPSASPHQLVVYSGHQGFVRLALEEGAWLVPVLAIGETLQLANLISAPDLQRATYKRLGFPVPFILAGRWGVTTLPLRNPLVYVLGKPLAPPAGWAAERRQQLAALQPNAVRRQEEEGKHGGEEEEAGAEGAGAGAAGLRRRRRGGDACGGGQRDVAPAAAPSTAGGACVVVPQAVVDAYHAAFYASVADLWARHHHRHPVLCRAELVFEWGRHGPPPGWK
ncbi:hypothetical protein HXX76_011734 [Chlamydomonas incerta]|uniref:Diacylglycerol O-acyltransferase n=1 Tax=Chlamydomonas incerta TaxID=51695 RepID=A0A835VRH1_CHLIN|nr:hypothetical protein HXX76_011734 [Chlamydomonas incerta]|eukprot:KAG2426507.1 hypothetical protein HXX76_011734 [Chlamydomonas incerta]